MAHKHPANIARHDERSFGDRVADGVAAFTGSWKFIIIQTVIICFWVLFNTVAAVDFVRAIGLGATAHSAIPVMLSHLHWDPFPFVFLNLFMSAEAAYATPIILMSQNRQAEHDRLQAEHDYGVNEEALRLSRAVAAHLGVDSPPAD